MFRISDPSDLPHTTLSTNEDCGEKQILPATVSEKELTPSVAGSVSKSILTDSAQKGKRLLHNKLHFHATFLFLQVFWKLKCSIIVYILAASNQQESMDAQNSSSVSKKQEATGNSLLISSDKKPLDTKQVNVTAPLGTAPSLALTGNTKPAVSFSFSTVNNEGTNLTGSKAPSGLAPSLQPSSSSFGNSQTGKGGLDSTQSVGTFGGSQNSNKDGGGYNFKSSLFASSGSVPVKTGERNETGFGNPSPQTSYTADRKAFGPQVALSSGPLPSMSPARPSLIGSSSSGYRTGNSEAPQSLHGPPPSQQTMGKSHSRMQAPSDYSRNSTIGTVFDSEQDLSKKFYSVRPLNIFSYYLYFSTLFPCTCRTCYHQCKGNFKQQMHLLFCGLVEHHPNIITYFGIFSALDTKVFPLLLQINEMTKELDALLSYIEKDGGFRDACITFQQRPLSMFEDGLQNFLELLQIFKVYDNCERSLLVLSCMFVVLMFFFFNFFY